MKYSFYWQDEPNEIIELEGNFSHPQEAAEAAAEYDFDYCGGYERENIYPTVIVVNELGEEDSFNISIDYDPVFYASPL